MRVDAFDFVLPENQIALRPASPRDAARLLVLPSGGPAQHRRVSDLAGLLRPGDALVLNDTRVIPARLHGRRARGEAVARIEILLHRRLGPDLWAAFARPAKRLAPGDRLSFGRGGASSVCDLSELHGSVEEMLADGEITIRFELAGAALDDAVESQGELPLPPYIASRRPADAADRVDYQTVFASAPGAVAAPTAALHLTPELLGAAAAGGVSVHRLTLHVGAGTFLPVKSDTTEGHRMHAEWGRIEPGTADALNEVRARGGRIVAVGTTSLRLLESAADESGAVRPFEGLTEIFITPGYRFKAVDLLMTNFHLPRSTLFMLVCAFAGHERMRAAYEEAIAAGYRFYSYGDASLLERTVPA